MKWFLNRFGSGSRAGGHPVLGALESAVMSRLWDASDETSVREVQRAFASLAYTTVMTTLDRLYKKGILTRRKIGRAFVYRPAVSREEFQGEMAGGVLQGLLAGSRRPEPVLSALVRTISEKDRALLDELERLVREERKRRSEP